MMYKQKTIRFLYPIAFFYIAVPFIIFLIGWTKWYFALLGTLLIAYCFYKFSIQQPDSWQFTFDKKTICKLIFVFLMIVAWVYLSGIGKYVFQNDDHLWRNAIFNVLVDYDWPVISKSGLSGTGSTALIYYINFWLPAALVGKVFGLQTGYFFLSYKNFYASEVNIKNQGHREVILYCTMKTCLL